MNWTILVQTTNQNSVYICIFFKLIRHGGDCLFSCRNRGEPSGSLNVPEVGVQRIRDSNIPHSFSYACSKSTGKYSVSELSVLLHSESTQKRHSSPEASLELTVTDTVPDD